jgi:hypothetical protein
LNNFFGSRGAPAEIAISNTALPTTRGAGKTSTSSTAASGVSTYMANSERMSSPGRCNKEATSAQAALRPSANMVVSTHTFSTNPRIWARDKSIDTLSLLGEGDVHPGFVSLDVLAAHVGKIRLIAPVKWKVGFSVRTSG